MSQKCKQIVGSILLLIFTAYYVNINFFQHSHIINGVTIVHSHIHNNTHTQTGTHNSSELTLISLLSSFDSSQAFIWLVGMGIFLLLKAIRPVIIAEKAVSASPFSYSLRAPPL
ncbi:hypothetical protein [Parabacteroides sp. PF5-6]|uniref:hypothetical protein n=1 Tax=Parabacteroides sp. PF5-6 TaxID=1742403 RepID=UPI0024049FEF|nr:hypothetical protein [Parabacteroides sp. PF5-6]MDF9830007.1 hypothetical protein [Parabacteroides sp. PF5-6]